MFHFLKNDSTRPFQFAKFLSWTVLLLIFSSGMLLSVFISNYARQTVLENHEEFALLLAENLNHQVYQRFILPTVIGYGRVQLKQKEQYERLSQVVDMTTHSFHVLDLKIYDDEGIISFSTDRSEVGEKAMDVLIQHAVEKGQKTFKVVSAISGWRALFRFQQEPETFVLRAVYPLRAEGALISDGNLGPLMGVLEFTQDITADYQTVIHFQWLIILASFISSFILFMVIFSLLRRADSLLEERLREKEALERELVQNEKLASMGRVVASIAHEIRNPLGIIRSTSELLCKKAEQGNEKGQKLLTAIYDESKRLSQTVTDFLDYARPKNPAMEDVDLGVVFLRISTFLQSEMRSHSVQVDVEVEPCRVKGDSELLYRAFYNLVINALQALESGGHILVRSEYLEHGVQITVEDNGPGFASDDEAQYLEPFYTTKASGTGLGLAIANTIFTSHGARMNLGKSPQGGALVRIVFPCLEKR